MKPLCSIALLVLGGSLFAQQQNAPAGTPGQIKDELVRIEHETRKDKEDKVITRKSRFTDVFVWRDATWQLVAGHSSRIPDAPAKNRGGHICAYESAAY